MTALSPEVYQEKTDLKQVMVFLTEWVPFTKATELVTTFKPG